MSTVAVASDGGYVGNGTTGTAGANYTGGNTSWYGQSQPTTGTQGTGNNYNYGGQPTTGTEGTGNGATTGNGGASGIGNGNGGIIAGGYGAGGPGGGLDGSAPLNSDVFPPIPLKSQLLRAMVNQDAQISYVGYDNTKFHISGPYAPILGAQTGVNLINIRGLDPGFKHLDNKGARQDGTTWYDTLFDPGEIDMTVEFGGMSAADTRRIIGRWFGAWDPKRPGKLCWFTPERGEWWADVRMDKPVASQFKSDWYQSKRVQMQWSMRNDGAFWKSVDSVCVSHGEKALSLTNTGDQPGWPRYLCYGPGTFAIAEPNVGGKMIEFGPLLPGQIVLLNTMPRLPAVVDLSPTAVSTSGAGGGLQSLIEALVSFITNNNVPPLLQAFESLFGILPPQGPLYSLLDGRFTRPIPQMFEGQGPVPASMPCRIDGGNSDSKIIAALTPLRRWPE